MVLQKTDWHAVQLHLMGNDGDYAATAEAFGLKIRNLHKQAERKGWVAALKRAREAKALAVSRAVAKSAESLASMSDSFKFSALKAAKKSMESFALNAPAIEDWQQAKLATEIVAKVAGWGSEAQVSVNFWGGSTPAMQDAMSCREVHESTDAAHESTEMLQDRSEDDLAGEV